MSPFAARRAISAVFFVNGALLAGWGAHIPDAKRIYSLSDGALGLVLLATAFGATLTMPLAGPLIHRFGSRTIARWAGFALCGLMPLLFISPSVPVLVATLVLVGATNGHMDVSMNSHSMVIQDRFDRPVLSAVHGWFSVGGFAGGMLTSQASRLGISPLHHLLAASLVLAMVLVVAVRQLLPAEVDQGGGEASSLALPKGRLWLIGGLLMAAFVGEGALWDWSAVYLRDGLHVPVWLAQFGFGVASFGMALARFLGDSWTHRLGRRRLFAFSVVVAGLGILGAVSTPDPTVAILALGAAGIGLANVVPLLFRAAAQVPGVSAGYGLAAVTTCGYSAFLAGPALVGFIAEWRSLAFALSLIGVLVVAMAFSTRRVMAE
jgi:MFS family permease